MTRKIKPTKKERAEVRKNDQALQEHLELNKKNIEKHKKLFDYYQKKLNNGKSNVVLSRNRLPCWTCKKLVKHSKIMLTKDKKTICEKCYSPFE